MKQVFIYFFVLVTKISFAQNDSLGLLGEANKAFNSKQFSKALYQYDKILKISKSNTEALFWRARTKVELKDLEGAKKDFENVLKLNPMHFGTLINLGNINSLLGDFNSALLYNQRAMEIDSLDKDVFTNRADIFYDMKKYELVIPAITKAIIIDPTDKELYKIRAESYNNTGKMDSARMDLESILKIDSNDIHAKTNLAFCNIISKDFASANRLYESLYQTEMNNPYILSNYGYVKHILGNSPEGLNLIMKSLKIMPENSYAYKYLAEIYLSRNDVEKTCEAIETGLKFGFTASFGPYLENMKHEHCK